MKFHETIEKYRKYSFTERDKGGKFEKLIQAYLKTDPKYANKLKEVWMWQDFPGRKDFGGKDTGIDLVALTVEGDYWAIQCKCYAEDAVIDKPSVDSFLATSSRTFLDEELKSTGFAHRYWISTTNHWGTNAEEAIKNQRPPVTRLNLYELESAAVNWEILEKGITGDTARTKKKTLRPHQITALENTHEYFKTSDRGKLIMACGTGKTFTSLRIAEKETDGKGLILFLVPSIALLGQTLSEWTADAEEPIDAVCICSDERISSKKILNEDTDKFSVVDLALPASTDIKNIIRQFSYIKMMKKSGMTVVFSTYQSIEVISRAQTQLLKTYKGDEDNYIFDLIICDEAHRTTGVALTKDDSSDFIKVHDNDFIKARKRLYMTATPRLYSDDSKAKAAEREAILCSMDDETIYGKEMYRIGFGEAVDNNLLSDYKVFILTLSDSDMPASVQKILANSENEINSDDATKLIGCINALSKNIIGDDGTVKSTDPGLMKTAVAFCPNIKASKMITHAFNTMTETYLSTIPIAERNKMVSLSSDHIDGTMSAPDRDQKLGWLKSSNYKQNECKVLTNVRCLSEGVDVPSLDAVMFLSPKNSQVEVVQSVGRVMRKSLNKKYGYIIIPVVIPSDVDPKQALDDNERYKVVWTVLNALRAHDDRFNSIINKIDLNKKKPPKLIVGKIGKGGDTGGVSDEKADYGDMDQKLALQFEQLQSVVFAKMVQKVGDRTYWEQWAKNVAEIAEKQVERINKLVKQDGTHKKAFNDFLGGLQKNINPSITQQEAVEMLSQHIITKPVFEALFEGYSFVKNNAISLSMQKMLDLIEDQAVEKDLAVMDKFYHSVKNKAKDIDNAEGKQRIIIELYDKFFKTAFPKLVEKLGIVYTPVEAVDFIIHSVNHVLKEEFGRNLSDENIHILDPFTGTGTFITRLLQSGLIDKKNLRRKYEKEIHANEIVLLAYYIAAVNIENAYHDITGDKDYRSFDGICLTDTFQLGETEEGEKLFSEMFPQNSARVAAQKKAPLRVIIGNPPYSVGAKSANPDERNLTYPVLEKKVDNTYAKYSSAHLKNALYDSYIKSFRWSTDRLDPENGGIICFISNGAWIEGNSQDGFRKCLEKEFSKIYVFNLRGNCRTQGELRRKEAGNVFGEGTRTPITITLLVKKPDQKKDTKAEIFYHDIGDYLNREEKLEIVKIFSFVGSDKIPWKILEPNEHGDWINERSDSFNEYVVIGSKDKAETRAFFNPFFSNGVKTNRDAWVYNYSKKRLINQITKTIEFYNSEVNRFISEKEKNSNVTADKFLNFDANEMISWSGDLVTEAEKGNFTVFEKNDIRYAQYRPYMKCHMYFNRVFNNSIYQIPKIFPKDKNQNYVICLPAPGGNKELTVIISNIIPDLHLNGDSQCFPLYYYEKREKSSNSLFDSGNESEFVRRDGISDFILDQAKKIYGPKMTKEDIFYYVYGFLHSPEYRIKFANDLKKMLPRLPLVDEPRDFWKFSKAGRELAELHINYETVPAYDDVKVTGADKGFFKVEKMRFPSKEDKSKIIYNSQITIENIPDRAYEYVVNGKSAIEWIMERYQVTTHKESGIKNDPNDWADEVGNPRYILDLLLSIINVSVKTVDIVNGLPRVKWE
ncbi:MAG TPA: DEAD/DEAH box helicase family protein [Clostridiales bacterium]|nr:DEAD/DEAH box helicase family protein [Clostridiales bacterium]HQP70637.1 DEAD/DEAH box helicase family protein [Clostridiales bacterium]